MKKMKLKKTKKINLKEQRRMCKRWLMNLMKLKETKKINLKKQS